MPLPLPYATMLLRRYAVTLAPPRRLRYYDEPPRCCRFRHYWQVDYALMPFITLRHHVISLSRLMIRRAAITSLILPRLRYAIQRDTYLLR